MRSAHRRATLGALAAFVLLAVGACGSDTATGPDGKPIPTTPAGIYGLSAVNGKALPVTMFTDTAFTEVIAGASIALQTDGKYLYVVTTNETVDGNLSVYVDSTTGTWTQAGNTSALTFTIAGDPTAPVPTGVWSGNSLTLTSPDASTWAFTRR